VVADVITSIGPSVPSTMIPRNLISAYVISWKVRRSALTASRSCLRDCDETDNSRPVADGYLRDPRGPHSLQLLMVIRNEARFQGVIKRDLELAGALVLNIHGGAVSGISYQGSGWPDLMVFHGSLPGGCCGLELKMQGGSERTNQVVKLRMLQDRRFRGFFLRYWKDGDLTFEVQRHVDDKTRQVLLVSGWESSCKDSDVHGRRERGHLLLNAVNEAWEHEFGKVDAENHDSDGE